MTTTNVAVPRLSNIQTMILRGIKKRKISMSSIALEYRPTADLSSKERNQAFSDFSKVVDISVIERLIADDRFDSLTRAEILDELIAAST